MATSSPTSPRLCRAWPPAPRPAGTWNAAGRHLAEAITIAAPRGLIPAHVTALTARARLRATQAVATGNSDALAQGRDDADAARRLATRHHLPWHELDALPAHATLDDAEDTSHGWAAHAAALRAQLVPPGLDRDPMKTVERQAAERDTAPTNHQSYSCGPSPPRLA